MQNPDIHSFGMARRNWDVFESHFLLYNEFQRGELELKFPGKWAVAHFRLPPYTGVFSAKSSGS